MKLWMEVLDALLAATREARHGTGYLVEIARTTDGANGSLKLEELRVWLTTALSGATEEERARL